jgi:hypothetical protein
MIDDSDVQFGTRSDDEFVSGAGLIDMCVAHVVLQLVIASCRALVAMHGQMKSLQPSLPVDTLSCRWVVSWQQSGLALGWLAPRGGLGTRHSCH